MYFSNADDYMQILALNEMRENHLTNFRYNTSKILQCRMTIFHTVTKLIFCKFWPNKQSNKQKTVVFYSALWGSQHAMIKKLIYIQFVNVVALRKWRNISQFHHLTEQAKAFIPENKLKSCQMLAAARISNILFALKHSMVYNTIS